MYSLYFGTSGELSKVANYTIRDEVDNWYLNIGAEIKNYDGEIDKFWEWISPWIEEPIGTIMGTCKHEEYDNGSDVIVGNAINYGFNL